MIPVKRKFAGGVKSRGQAGKKGTSQSSRTPCFCIIISGIYQKRYDSANYLLFQVGISAKLPYQTYTYV